MKKTTLLSLAILLGGLVIGCDLFDDDGVLADGSVLLVVNTAYDINDSEGQAVGTLPRPKASVDLIRSAGEARETAPARTLLKDLPPRVRKKAQAPPQNAPPEKIDDSTTTRTFFAYNASDTVVTIPATRRALGEKCYVFVENGEEGLFDWEEVADLFDNQVWPKDTGIFGEPTDVDDNGKVVILYFKMRDSEGVEEPMYLGYFYSGDLITGPLPPGYEYSNGMEVFYMNLSFADPLHEEMQRTLFHEFQHMINYGQRVAINAKPGMDLWLDEGLAESAEHYGLETPGRSRINALNADSEKTLRNGQSLFVWEGDEINYGLSYTFVQYLRLQCEEWEFMTELIDHEYGDYRALEDVIGDRVGSLDKIDKMLMGYYKARLINGSGLDGFKGDPAFKFTIRPPTINLNGFKLLAGGALYLPIEHKFTPKGQGKKIEFYTHIMDQIDRR